MYFKSKLKSYIISISILTLSMTQVPLAINESIKLGCILTTWSDYDAFWSWKEIPLDSRVRYCNGGNVKNVIAEKTLKN